MKKYLLSFICFCITIGAFSQTNKNEFVLGLGAGYSLFQEPLATNFRYSEFSRNTTLTPTITADYAITNKFSMGLQIGFLSNNLKYTQAARLQSLLFDFYETTKRDDVAFRYNEITISYKPMYHFVLNNKLDVYSGLRLGYFKAFANVQDPHPEFDVRYSFDRERVSVAVIPIGVRYYPGKSWGLNFDTSFGKPYVVAVGAVYKVNNKEVLEENSL